MVASVSASSVRPNDFVRATAVIAAGAIAVFYSSRLKAVWRILKSRCLSAIHASTPLQPEKAAKLRYGWLNPTAVAEDFDWQDANCRNYFYTGRAVRAPMRPSMAHRPLPHDYWLEIDKDYKHYLELQAGIISRRGPDALDCLPGYEAGPQELLAHVVDYLPRRYPMCFESTGDTGLHNLITRETYHETASKTGMDALRIISQLVQGDMLIANKGPDGSYLFTAAISCLPGSWKLSDKIGTTMHATHVPVPEFNEKLLKSVERTFDRITPEGSFEREAFGLVDDNNAEFHGMSQLGPGQQLDPAIWEGQDLRIKVSHQNIRKLPRTSTIIFHVRATYWQLSDIGDMPLLPKLMLMSLQSYSEEEANYMGAKIIMPIAGPYLEKLHQEQIAKGMISGHEDPQRYREFIGAGQSAPTTRTPLHFVTPSQKRRDAALKAGRSVGIPMTCPYLDKDLVHP